MNFRQTRRDPQRPRPKLNLRKTLFVLPNLVTLASVFCGFNAIRLVAEDQPSEERIYRAAVLLMFAMLFDLLDGRIARLTKTQSAFGLQLDSLADVISFGVAPALLVYKWVLYREPTLGLVTAFVFVAAAAVRLARFNVLASNAAGVPTKPSKYILGLPTPPSSGILISLIVADRGAGGALSKIQHTTLFFGVMFLLSFLMVSNVRFRSFKDLKLNTGTLLMVLFSISSSVFIWQHFRPQFVLIWLLSVYVLLGIAETLRALTAYLFNPPQDRPSAPPVS